MKCVLVSRDTTPEGQTIVIKPCVVRDADIAFAGIPVGAEIDVTVKKWREKRSLNANSYMWRLCDEIAKVLHTSREEVYRRHIRDNGVYQDVAVVGKAASAFMTKWRENGVGWFCECFQSKLPGCMRIRCYYGSSVYDTAEMSRLIDDVVYEASNLGIETLPEDDLLHMKSLWEKE